MLEKLNKLITNIGNNIKNFFTDIFKKGEVKGSTDIIDTNIETTNFKMDKESEKIDITKELSARDLMKCISEEKIPENIIKLANEVVDERNGSATLDINEDISLILIRNENDGIDIYNSNSLEKPFAELSKSDELEIKDFNIANQLFNKLGFNLLNDLKHVEVSNGPDLNAILNVQGQER